MIRALLLTIVVLLLARAFWRVVDGILEAASGRPERRANPVKLVRDPVCGTYVSPGSALSLTAKGRQLDRRRKGTVEAAVRRMASAISAEELATAAAVMDVLARSLAAE